MVQSSDRSIERNFDLHLLAVGFIQDLDLLGLFFWVQLREVL